MRVLFLLDNYDDDDPAGILFHRLCQRWAPIRQLNLSTIAFGGDGPLAERLRALGIGARVLPWDGLQLANVKLIREEGRRLLARADRPDVIMSFGCWPDVAARLFHGGNKFVPLVHSLCSSCHCCATGGRGGLLPKIVERFTRNWVGNFVICSESMREDLERRGIPHQRTVHIHMGVDGVQCFPVGSPTKARFRSLLGVPAEAPLILCAGRLSGEGGQSDLIAAMPKILAEQPAAHLYLIGDGPCREKLVAEVERRGLGKSVRIIGHLSSILAKLYSTADVVVHTAAAEAFPINIAEAQAAGTPVVAYRAGSNAEIIQDEATGFLVDPGSSDALATAVLRLIEDPELRHSMGEAARQFILENREITQTADAYVLLWRDLVPVAPWETTTSMRLEDLEEIKREVAGAK